jgi:UDP-glucose 4-epimerase
MREALVIPQFVRKALDSETITIHGDGSQFRNYVYIEDLADAHAICLKDIGENGTFNLEGAEPVSIRRLTEAVQRALGRPIAVEFLSDRPGDFRGREVSAIKAAQVLGWRATTSFDEGLKRYVDWYRATHQRGEESEPPAG